jgi:hypothetical protein
LFLPGTKVCSRLLDLISLARDGQFDKEKVQNCYIVIHSEISVGNNKENFKDENTVKDQKIWLVSSSQSDPN